jgi:hypothetical protein
MDPRAHLSIDINNIVGSTLAYKNLALGQTVRIEGRDARTGQPTYVYLQPVHYEKMGDKEVVVFAILDSDFNFIDQETNEPANVKIGTFAIGGLSMTWLPQPVYSMVGTGGIGGRRDYSLEFVGGKATRLIIPRISEIAFAAPPDNFVPPEGIDEFLAQVTEIEEQEVKSSSPEQLAQARLKYTEWLKESLGEEYSLLGEIDQLLNSLCLDGLYGVGDFLVRAHQEEKLTEAIKVVEKGFREQWNYQHPDVCGHPQFGSNFDYMLACYENLGISQASNKVDTKLGEGTDDHLNQLRTILENGPAETDQEVESIMLESQSAGTIIIVETESGNRYLVEVVAPKDKLINLMQLKRRLGMPEDGIFRNQYSSDLIVGRQLNVTDINTSPLAKIYIIKR